MLKVAPTALSQEQLSTVKLSKEDRKLMKRR
jgi:hypothetical protein